MNWIAGVDEVGSETQISEGWTYAILPDIAISAIDRAVSSCDVKNFHGKKFKKAQESQYETFLSAARDELIKHQNSSLTFTLLNLSWKSTFIDFSNRLVSGGLGGADVNDSDALAIAQHLFPGLITFQRLTASSNLEAIDIEIDSDDIAKKLSLKTVLINGRSVPVANLLCWAYEAHRKQRFQGSPRLGTGGIRALSDAKSRAIQLADVFGNFALSYIFVQHGNQSKSRIVKAGKFERVFGNEIKPGPILSDTRLSGKNLNDIEISHSGALTLRLG